MGATKGELRIAARAPERPERIAGQRLGRLVARVAGQGVLVDFRGNPHGPIAARVLASIDVSALAFAADSGAEVLLSFDDEQTDRPIVVGLLHPATSAGAAAPNGVERREALVDGQRVVLNAQDEIVLRCGKASITLRRNGRIVLRGTYLETNSEGVNRVKGAAVRIN